MLSDESHPDVGLEGVWNVLDLVVGIYFVEFV